MQDEEGAGHAVLLHEVLPLADLAQPELLEQQLLYLLVFNQRGEGEVGPQTFQDQRLVRNALLLHNLQEVLADLVVVYTSNRSNFP